mgnify:CR=1 FL=1
MLNKELVIHSIQDLPEQFSLEDLIEHLMLMEKVKKGQQQVKDQQTFSTEEARTKLNTDF